MVVLGEGDSEELVIPRVAKASDVDLDGSFAAVVPLGGRFVNHFWRLLHGLDVPHVTLLDLDRERLGGGWARVHYAIQQLLNVGVSREQLLTVFEGADSVPIMTIHKSKGLEYNTVIFVGLEDSAMWSFTNSPDEEKRTFFVAFSRAIQRVFFTFCRVRERQGRGEEGQSRRSIGIFYDTLREAGIEEEQVTF